MGAPKGHPPYNILGEGGKPKVHTIEFIENEAVELEKWMLNKENIFAEDFAFERHLRIQRFCEWVKISERFAAAYLGNLLILCAL